MAREGRQGKKQRRCQWRVKAHPWRRVKVSEHTLRISAVSNGSQSGGTRSHGANATTPTNRAVVVVQHRELADTGHTPSLSAERPVVDAACAGRLVPGLPSFSPARGLPAIRGSPRGLPVVVSLCESCHRASLGTIYKGPSQCPHLGVHFSSVVRRLPCPSRSLNPPLFPRFESLNPRCVTPSSQAPPSSQVPWPSLKVAARGDPVVPRRPPP